MRAKLQMKPVSCCPTYLYISPRGGAEAHTEADVWQILLKKSNLDFSPSLWLNTSQILAYPISFLHTLLVRAYFSKSHL